LGKPQGKRIPGKPTHRWQENTETHLKKHDGIGRKGFTWLWTGVSSGSGNEQPVISITGREID
jgi:hypothetical protein